MVLPNPGGVEHELNEYQVHGKLPNQENSNCSQIVGNSKGVSLNIDLDPFSMGSGKELWLLPHSGNDDEMQYGSPLTDLVAQGLYLRMATC